jgi:hypothetical protein
MMSRFTGTLGAIVVLCLGLRADAGPIQIGGSYNLAVQNFPGNLSTTPVTLDGAVHSLTTSAGTLNLQATIYDVDINTQWLDFAFSTPGGPLASNFNASWQWTISSIPLSEAALLAGAFYYWSVDGQPVDPIHNWQGGQLFPDGIDGTNPITGVGKGFGGLDATPNPLPTNNSFFVNPYRLLGNTGLANEGDMPHTNINDFHFAFLITAADPQQGPVIPEPGSLVVWLSALGLCGLGWARWTTRRAVVPS